MKYKLIRDKSGLQRVEAVRDGLYFKAGDVGAVVASAKNLSQEGECWANYNSRISGDAEVQGDALVRDSGVYNSALVSGKALVEHSVMQEDSSVIEEGHLLHSTTREFATVRGQAYVSNSRLEGYCIVGDNAMVTEFCHLMDRARVGQYARLYSYIVMKGRSLATGGAMLTGTEDEPTTLLDDSEVTLKAQIISSVLKGRAHATDRAYVAHSIISGDADVSGSVRASMVHEATVDERTVIYNGVLQHSRDFLTIGPIGSRNDYVTFHRGEDSYLRVVAGCFKGTLHEFEQKVEDHHNEDAQEDYEAAMKLAKQLFVYDFEGRITRCYS